MKYVGNHDRLLLGGLAVALVVVFAKPIQYLLDLARDVESGLGLSLPALIILTGLTGLTGVFVLHQQRKRQEEQALVRAAEAAARQAEARTAELERLVAFGEALGRALTLDAIRDVVLQQLPRLTGTDRAWVMVRQEGRWQAFAHEAGLDREKLELSYMDVVERAVPNDPTRAARPSNVYGHMCLPMTVAGEVVGLLAVPESDSATDGRRRVLAAAATLLGTSLRNSQLFREVKDNSLRDGLTGCYNRTHTLEVIGTELRRARRSHQPLSLIMLDIDHFKQINDRHGHLCGDGVLATVGARMRESLLRGSDLKCRYGGEEFLVLLPETPIEGARRVAETLRRAFADRAFQWKDERLQITASFGVSVALPSETDTQALIGRADLALYRAKNEGRNRVHSGT